MGMVIWSILLVQKISLRIYTALFYSPTYRKRYAPFLKIDFPRVPLTSNVALFRALCSLGDRLVSLHVMEQVYTTRFLLFLFLG